MKIGDKVRVKNEMFIEPMARGKEGTIIEIHDDLLKLKIDFGNSYDGYLVIDKRDVELVEEYQPKHAKEMVNHPEHYNQGKYECIDEMIALFGVERVIGFCMCNIYKYKTRASHKNGEEDMRKADWYMDKLLELMRGKDENQD